MTALLVRVVAILLLPATSLASDSLMPVSVVASVAEGSQISIRIAIKNLGIERIELPSFRVPWHSYDSIILSAFPAGNPDAPLQLSFPIQDPPRRTIAIAPGETVEGVVYLPNRFGALEEVLRKEEVVLFWSFVGKDVKGRTSSRFGGWVALPRSK